MFVRDEDKSKYGFRQVGIVINMFKGITFFLMKCTKKEVNFCVMHFIDAASSIHCTAALSSTRASVTSDNSEKN